ncbi:hypothetical protein [Streptomyces sp. NPDC127190]|uniref:SLOG cluster 4 domain-containing protein n=1 Tax=unclassified Streptomyces TaxID=2593676 RepID=UPI0036308EE9
MATALGEGLGLRGADLVYGAGGAGIMGAVSQAAHRSGARVTGVIPHARHPRTDRSALARTQHAARTRRRRPGRRFASRGHDR